MTADTTSAGGAAAAPATLLTADPAASAASTAAAVAAPAAAPWSWADESGKFNDGWQDRLGDELKGDSSLKVIPDLKTLAKVFVDTKKMVGKRVAPPTDRSTPEEITAWRKLMNAPEKLEDYGNLRPKDIPEELWDVNVEAEARALAHKHHLPASVLQEFAALNVKGTQAAYAREQAAAAAALEKGKMELRTAWGENFERNRARALAVAAALGIPETDEMFLSRPDILIKLADAAPSFLGGDKLVAGAAVGVSGGIEDRIRAVSESPEYQGTRGGPAQDAAQARLHQLLEARDAVKQKAA